MPLLLVRNDVTKMNTDAIVCPANRLLMQAAGTSHAVFSAAGEKKLETALEAFGPQKIGDVVITEGFNLQAKYIIHAVCPQWRGGKQNEERILYDLYISVMKLAKERGLESVAFPLLSTGNSAFPRELAFDIATRALNDFTERNDMTAYIVLYDQRSFDLSREISDIIDEYIDDNYVAEKDESFSKYQKFIKDKGLDEESLTPVADGGLEAILSAKNESFVDMLLRLIDERGLTDPEVYHRANIDRKLFSKIKNTEGYTPTKKTILALAIALKLTKEESTDLLMKAGYAFSNSSRFDIIVEYFIEHRRYDVYEINRVLFAYNQPLLGQ